MPDLSLLANLAQIISLPVAIIAILTTALLSVWLYQLSRQRRALVCEFDPIVFPIEIKAGEALEGDIEIHYKGEPVENLSLVRVKLKNAGNQAIRKEHIVEPVTFTFGPDAELLRTPRVLDKRPENLKIDWDLGEISPASRPRAINLDFDLFNPGEQLTVEFMCTGKSALPEVAARIEGITEIELLTSEDTYWRRQLTRSLSLLFLILGAFLYFAWVAFKDDDLSMNPFWAGILATVLVVGTVSTPYLLWSQVVKSLFELLRYRRYKGES